MEVILLEKITKLGDPGDLVNIKSGYARNYLIPEKIASIATVENIKRLEKWIEQQTKSTFFCNTSYMYFTKILVSV